MRNQCHQMLREKIRVFWVGTFGKYCVLHMKISQYTCIVLKTCGKCALFNIWDSNQNHGLWNWTDVDCVLAGLHRGIWDFEQLNVSASQFPRL